MRNAPRNYSILVISQVATALFSFASVWLIARRLGSEGYGGVVAVIAASQVAQIFVNWTLVALARYGIQEFVETGRINRSFWARAIVALPNTVILLALSFLWLPILSSWLKLPPDAGWYVAAHFMVTAAWFHVQFALQGAKLPRLHGILLAIERVLIFSVLLTLILIGRLDFYTAIAAYITAPLVMASAGLYQIRNLFSWRIEVDMDWLRKMLRFSLPLIPYSLIGYFAGNYLDAIFISQYLSKGDLGVYSVAYQISGILMQFPLLAGNLLMPLFVTRQNESTGFSQRYFRNVLPGMTLLWGIFCTIVAAVAFLLLPLVFGPEFSGGPTVLWILITAAAVSLPAFVGYFPLSNSISATYIAMLAAMASALINVSGDLLLIPIYGLKGCAMATVLSYLTNVMVSVILLKWAVGVPLSWTLVATLPAVSGCLVLFFMGPLLAALSTALGLSLLLALFERESLRDMTAFLNNLDFFQKVRVKLGFRNRAEP